MKSKSASKKLKSSFPNWGKEDVVKKRFQQHLEDPLLVPLIDLMDEIEESVAKFGPKKIQKQDLICFVESLGESNPGGKLEWLEIPLTEAYYSGLREFIALNAKTFSANALSDLLNEMVDDLKAMHRKVFNVEIRAAQKNIENEPYIFRKRKGRVWDVRYENEDELVLNSDGMTYIAWLLKYAGHPIPVNELYSDLLPIDRQPIVFEDRLTINKTDKGIELTDRKTINAIKQRIDELEQRLSVNSLTLDEKENLEEELEKSKAYISQTVGLHGKIRLSGDKLEKIRSAVTNAINRSIQEIARSHPKLAKHLDEHIKRGKECVYTPKNSKIKWLT